MTFRPPTPFNIADHFLDARVREGRGDRVALRHAAGTVSYADLKGASSRFGHLLLEAGVRPGDRVIVALPDSPDYVAALFGILKAGAVVVMLNPHLKRAEVDYLLEYTGATAAFVHPETGGPLTEAVAEAREAGGEGRTLATGALERVFRVGTPDLESRIAQQSALLEPFAAGPDDPAIWLFSGGTTGFPKGVVQSHRSFANTTELYAKGVIGYTEDDVTASVPKLYFGYATGSNLFFPMSVGASCVLFPERCEVEVLFDVIERFRPTILVNVPTMVNHMVGHPRAAERDLSSLRLSTSAGEALPRELHERWRDLFGVELVDGLGTAEMWHIFLSNRPGEVRPGSLGRAVPGFEVRVCDAEGREVPDGEVGYLRVRGESRAIEYWRHPEKTARAFRGDWYVSEDMLRRDEEGFFYYEGRADDMLKVSGKWLSPGEVENCLMAHPAVVEVAVVGHVNTDGLTKPWAFVRIDGDHPATPALEGELQQFVKDRLAPYKYPRRVIVMDDLPRTHLGKIDRGRLRGVDS